MAKKPTAAASGYVTTRPIAIMGVHYAEGEPVTDLRPDEINTALAHGWIIAAGDAGDAYVPADAAD